MFFHSILFSSWRLRLKFKTFCLHFELDTRHTTAAFFERLVLNLRNVMQIILGALIFFLSLLTFVDSILVLSFFSADISANIDDP